MSGLLTDEEIARLMPSEMVPHATPVPTQIVASDEYYYGYVTPPTGHVPPEVFA